MDRSYIMDKQIPRSYWYWAIRHAARVHNIFPETFQMDWKYVIQSVNKSTHLQYSEYMK